MTWSEKALGHLNDLNNFGTLSKPRCKRFYIDNKLVGFIRPDVWKHLKPYSTIFIEDGNTVHIANDLNSCEARTNVMDEVLLELRSQGNLVTLKGWRNECYNVKESFHLEALMKMERAATCLFGVRRYGVNIHGYITDPDKGICMWIGKRSQSKETYPGKLDLMTAGGLTSGLSVNECARKEADEEAGVPEYLLDSLQATGTASFAYEDERGVFRDTEFCYDLRLPTHFTPHNNDGEVDGFQLLSVDQVKPLIVSDAFKPTSGALVMDFMIRHGVITPDTEPLYVTLNELLHAALD